MASICLRRAAQRTCLPLFTVSTVSATFYLYGRSKRDDTPRCDAAAAASPRAKNADAAMDSGGNQTWLHTQTGASLDFEQGMQRDLESDFHGLFPMRQLWIPKLSYPLWDKNWDGRHPTTTGDEEKDHRMQRHLRKHGVTRHIILVRHGQYDETHKEDEKRILTPLGRQQAHLTGKRIAEMMKGSEEKFGPCRIQTMRVSGLTRARETAAIIATHLPGVTLQEPDPILNEGRPCHTIPGGPASARDIETTDSHHGRIEEAFTKYFYRAPVHEESHPNAEEYVAEKHEFEVIVCHANVIRYHLCRALQLPPEAWLRYCPFNCSLTYLTIRPTGTVSCRMMGDIGHLPYNACTFSGHHGYNW